MSVYRDSGRFDDSRSVASARTTGGTKVTRYIVKEDDYDRRSHYDDGHRSAAPTRYDDRRTEIDIRDDDRYTSRTLAREPEYRGSRETITIRREESPERRDRDRDRYWERPPGEAVQDRELVIRRTVERDNVDRAPPRNDDRSVVLSRADDRRESRFSDYEVVSPQRPSLDDREREVQRYIRTTDYYNPPAPQQPQTIIIRQEPIIIRERYERERSPRREEDFQIVKKSDIDDQHSVSRRSRSEARDEEYFYEKKVRERLPDDRDDRRLRRPISPHDSISQVGRRGRDRGYESDDSMVYVRKEKIEDYGSSDDEHRGRDLAAGALAGVGAAELIRNHNRKEGKETSNGVSRVAKDVGAGALGAAAAEAIRRYRSKSRRRSRSDSRGRGRRQDSREGSRARSESHSNLKSLGGLGLAAAAVAAGALIANRSKKGGSPDRGSRSRSRRRGSRSRSRASSRASAISELENDPTADDERNPKKRNQRTAAAGALGAAAMALYENQRSKSQGRGRNESPKRLKQGAQVVGGGLAAAALARLYENRKAKEEATEIVDSESRRSRSRHRSRSRPRTDSTYYDGPSQRAYSDPNLIQYGTEPLYGNNFGEGYYGRPQPEQDYYQNQNRDIVPAPAPPPATSQNDSFRPGRPRSVSSSRSRSRSRGAAAAAAAVGAGVAASELENRRREKKERKRRSRNRSREGSYTPTADDRARQNSYTPYAPGRDPYEDANWHATHPAGNYSQGMNDPYASQTGFPPPPGAMPQSGFSRPTSQPNYAPQDFPPPPAGAPQAQQGYYDPYAPGQNPYMPRGRGDENVSAASSLTPPDQHHFTTNGLNREIATTPPVIGPNIAMPRPLNSTSANQQSTSGNPASVNEPYQQPKYGEPNNSSTPFPGPRPAERLPERSASRAAKAYTPTPPLVPQDTARRQPSPLASVQAETIPVITDRPSPLPSQQRQLPEDPRVTAFRQAAYNAPPPSQQRAVDPAAAQPDMTAHDRVTKPQPQNKQPEMQQTNRGVSPFISMPSPDIRPPSDEYIPIPQPQQAHFDNPYQSQSVPSMPNLFVPEPIAQTTKPQTYTASTREPRQERRTRSRSQSQPRSVTNTTAPGTATTSRTATPEPKKSVSFAPQVEFSDAPVVPPASSSRDRPYADSENNPDTTRPRRHDRDPLQPSTTSNGNRRTRDKNGRGYDAGDDLSDDTPFEDHRRRTHNDRDRSRDTGGGGDRGVRHSSRRERRPQSPPDRDTTDPNKRSNTMSGSGSSGSSSKQKRRSTRDNSPDSDATVDLPERFDERGKRKPGSYDLGTRSPEEELIAQGLDKILGGLFKGSGSGSGVGSGGGGSSKRRRE
ncbi:hypothetical protein LTS08_004985 [Lithohypha guttulata]|nr:hypothetical protein LTS08_004985 [Lithohypha guttulata]